MFTLRLIAGIITIVLLYVGLFGCKGIIPIVRDIKKRKES